MLKRAAAHGFARAGSSSVCPHCELRRTKSHITTLRRAVAPNLPLYRSFNTSPRLQYSSSAAKPLDHENGNKLDPADEANIRRSVKNDVPLPSKELVEKWKAEAERKFAAKLDWPRYLKWRAATRSRSKQRMIDFRAKGRQLRKASRKKKDKANLGFVPKPESVQTASSGGGEDQPAKSEHTADASSPGAGNAISKKKTEADARSGLEPDASAGSPSLTAVTAVSSKQAEADTPPTIVEQAPNSAIAHSPVRHSRSRRATRSATSVKRTARVQTLKEALLTTRDRAERKSDKVEKMEASLTQMLNVSDLTLQAIEAPHPPIPRLSYGLDRVLFNPGVYLLRDARSRVFNFDPYLEKVIPVAEFDFNTLSAFMTPSTDPTLAKIASEQKKKYVGSTSSMTGVLKQFHFLLSRFRRLNFSMLSKSFPIQSEQMTVMNRSPDAIFLRWKDGAYAVDADKQYDTPNVLSMMGKFMEKLLTIDKTSFEKHRVGQSHQLDAADKDVPEAYHYSTMGDFVIRSQLDAHDPRLPGKGIFDLKTRAVLPVRMDTKDFHWGMDYEIKDIRGQWQSFEREYHDMARSTMLKYSLQVRLGRMDGIFVAYHNIRRIFGFQYIPLEEMDLVMHGTSDTTLGDQELLASLQLMNSVFDRATERFPEQTIRFHFQTRETQDPFLYIFAEPVAEEEADRIQTANKQKIEDWEAEMLGRTKTGDRASAPSPGELDSKEHSEQDASSEFVPGQDATREVASGVVEMSGPLYSNGAGSSKASFASSADDTGRVNEAAQVKNEGPLHAKVGQTTAPEAENSREESTEVNKAERASPEKEHDTDDKNCSRSKNTPRRQRNGHDTTLDGEREFLEGLASEAEKEDALLPDTPLMAMILHVRSEVNGKRTPAAPENLKKSDSWKVKYSIQEVTERRRAWRLYEACKARRQKVYSEEEVDVAAGAGKQRSDNYLDILRDIVKESLNYRRKLDSSDNGKDVRMWDDEKRP